MFYILPMKNLCCIAFSVPLHNDTHGNVCEKPESKELGGFAILNLNLHILSPVRMYEFIIA